MAGLFATFNIVRRAMSTQQGAINTTSHNIANANTEGYSRQRAIMETTAPEGMPTLNSSSGPGQIGTGVNISEVTRARDEFLDGHIRDEISIQERFRARDEFLSEVETVFMEPSSNGLSSSLNKMWSAWQEVANNPESSNTRTAVVQASLNLTDSIRHTYSQLEGLQNSSQELVQRGVADLNSLVTQIEDLNRQIVGVKIAGDNPNDLLDKQDLLIDNLSKLVDIKMDRDNLGKATIKTANGETLVGDNKLTMSYVQTIKNDNGQYTMTYLYKGDISKTTTINITKEQYIDLQGKKAIWTDSNGAVVTENNGFVMESVISGGSIKGYSSIYNELQGYKDQLDAMARALAVSVNTIHNDGHLPADYTESDRPFFVATDKPDDESAITAKNITVNPTIVADPSKVNVSVNTSSAEGEGDKALAISQLRDSRIFINEFLDTRSVIVSGKITDNADAPLDLAPVSAPADSEITITGNNKKAVISLKGVDSDGSECYKSLNQLADEINKLDNNKTLDSDKLFITAAVDNGKLIIQSLKPTDNVIDISDNKNGDVLKSLKIYDKEDADYWKYVRSDNMVVNSYDPSNMKIENDSKGTTIDNYFKDIIGKLGFSTQEAKSMVSNQEALVNQLNARKESISGVSLDEEMTNLLQYQRAYQAAAKMVNVVDDLMNVIVNGLIR